MPATGHRTGFRQGCHATAPRVTLTRQHSTHGSRPVALSLLQKSPWPKRTCRRSRERAGELSNLRGGLTSDIVSIPAGLKCAPPCSNGPVSPLGRSGLVGVRRGQVKGPLLTPAGPDAVYQSSRLPAPAQPVMTLNVPRG